MVPVNLIYTTGGPPAQSQQSEGSYESSNIQITQQRWEEESAALDGHAAHLCMAVLKEEIVEHLLKIYEQEIKPKDAAAKTPGPSDGIQDVPSSSLSVPHPSDRATPSSPRNAATVDQLRSSLRQVADALAQTVAAVRNTREQLQDPLGTSDDTMATAQDESAANEEEDEEEEEQVHSSAEDPEANFFLPLPPLPPPSLPSEQVQQVPSSSLLNPAAPGTFQVSDILAGASSTGASVTASTTLPLTTSHTISLSSAGASVSLSSSSQVSTTSTTVSSFSLPTPMFTQATSLAHVQTSPTPTTTTTNTASAVSSFDGSQESARATLERTDPQDPLYTFLSAYVGDPPPPIVSSVEAPSSATSSVPQSQSIPLQPTQSEPPQTAPHSVSSQRLPVFTQMQLQPESHARPEPVPSEGLSMLPSQPTVDLTVPRSDTVMHSRVTSSPSPQTTATTSSSAQPPPTSSSLSTSEANDIISIAENIASQVTSFFQSNPVEILQPFAPPGSLDHTASLASSLAQELSMTVSQLTPTTSSSSDVEQDASFSQSLSATNSASNSLTLPQAPSTTLPGQSSPSPSDTLAPLISSLQMPTPPSFLGGEDRGTTGTERTLQREAEGSDTRRPTTGQILSQAGENIVAEETGTASMIAGRPWPEVGQIFEQGVGGESTLEPVVSSASGIESGSTSSATATAMSGEERSQGSAMEEDSTAGTSSGIAAGSDSAAAMNIPPTLRQLPDTIDQDVLAELPDHIRQEVLAQHAREQRARQARQEGFTTSISPEFLSALPPNIQEEVSPVWFMYIHASVW